MFSEEEPLFQDNKDRVTVFTEPGVLPEILSAGSDLIVVSTSPEIEKELAPHRQHLKTILVYSQNMANVNPDITLKPLNYFALTSALEEMGCSWNDVNRYHRECGYSLTVLRRPPLQNAKSQDSKMGRYRACGEAHSNGIRGRMEREQRNGQVPCFGTGGRN